MAETDHYIREENNVLRKENSEAKFTVRLHFTESCRDDGLMDEVQKILMETYIRSLGRV